MRIILYGTLILGVSAHAQSSQRKLNFEEGVKSFLEARAQESTDTEKSCARYDDLKRHFNSSLARLASLRRSIVCPTQETFEAEASELAWLGDWLKTSAQMHVSQGAKISTEDRLKSYLLQARIDDNQKNRLEAIDNGMKLAQAEKLANWILRFDEQRERVAPRLIRTPKTSDYPAIIDDYFSNLEYDAVRKWLNETIKKPGINAQDEFTLRRAIAQSYRRQQNRNANLKALKDLFNWVRKQKTLPSSAFQETLSAYARAMWTLGNRDGGEKLMLQHVGRLKGNEAAEIYWVLARMSEEIRAYAKSSARASKAIELSDSGSALHEKSLFLKAWNMKKSGSAKESIAAFRELVKLSRRPLELSKYSFWLAWMLEKHGTSKEKDEAKELFTRLETLDPYGYYGTLTFIHRGLPFPALMGENEKPRPGSPAPKDEMAEVLEAVKEKELLRKYLARQIAIWDGKTPADVKYHQAKKLSTVGGFLPLFILFGQLEPADRVAFFKDHPELIFPRKFSTEIDKAARERALPPELLYSIIRQESTYDPEARSPADAMGLMQVLASLGPGLAKRAGVKYTAFEDLFLPEVNIPLGSLLMKDLYTRFNGNILLTAASYNSNPVAVNRWIRARSNQSFIEFMEEIPYEETRTYMKLVLRNFVFYRRLQAPTKPTPIPKECLESLQFPKKSTPKKKK